MIITLQIGIGIWLGGLFLAGTGWAFIEIMAWRENRDRLRRMGLVT